jgi:hypothetical protein
VRRRTTLPFGVKEIGGLALGALHEIAGGGNGVVDGAAAALFAAGIAARTRGKVLWCVTRQDLFAPAIAQAGLGHDRVIYVEAGDEKSLLACFEEGLRHGALGAVVAEVARLSMMASRRLHLAAESSGAIGIAVRRWRRQTEAADSGNPTVVVTHHAPHANSLSDPKMDLRWCYASDLGDLIHQRQPDLWIHGHIHSRADYRLGKTRVICNARGHTEEESSQTFDPSLVISV